MFFFFWIIPCMFWTFSGCIADISSWIIYWVEAFSFPSWNGNKTKWKYLKVCVSQFVRKIGGLVKILNLLMSLLPLLLFTISCPVFPNREQMVFSKRWEIGLLGYVCLMFSCWYCEKAYSCITFYSISRLVVKGILSSYEFPSLDVRQTESKFKW